MKSVVLVPYCPLPIDSGGKVEMWKHLNLLKTLGPCRIVSARRRPVGLGWTTRYEEEIRSGGFELTFREEGSRITAMQVLGYLYGLACKGIGLEKAFGHSNPYHRFAFPPKWWFEQTTHADLAVINYSYWAWLPCGCPKVIALLDLWSDFMWEGSAGETCDLKTADLVVVISKEEEDRLQRRGVDKTLWSPPAVAAIDLPDSQRIGMVGSPSRVNREGLRWLSAAAEEAALPIRVYGEMADHAVGKGFRRIGRYEDVVDPYRECGIILMTTTLGMGVQIKVIEALASGRAIVARKGAMRGIPASEPGWIEVSTAEEMMQWAGRLRRDTALRNYWASRAAAYYADHLEKDRIHSELIHAYSELSRS